jgi:hypothetical protein
MKDKLVQQVYFIKAYKRTNQTKEHNKARACSCSRSNRALSAQPSVITRNLRQGWPRTLMLRYLAGHVKRRWAGGLRASAATISAAAAMGGLAKDGGHVSGRGYTHCSRCDHERRSAQQMK